jgi:hypothetical protein
MITGWASTDAKNSTICSRCQAKPGEPCQTPKKRRIFKIHSERSGLYLKTIGIEEFKRRHQRPLVKGLRSNELL